MRSLCRNALLLFSIVALAALPALANPSHPGQLVSVGSYRLYLECTGSGPGPTVVLIASRDSSQWDKVFPGIASFARVCRYDRMGTWPSDSIVPPDQTISEIVDDLHTLLANAGVKPPFLLVGHSIGGIYARKYTSVFPGEVAGLVFVDSANEEQVWRFEKISHSLLFEYRNWPNTYKLGQEGFLPPGSLSTWHTDVPLIVLEHGTTWPRGTFKGLTEEQYIELKQTWHSMQLDVSRRSPSGELRIADKAGHYIQTDRPDVVLQAIRDVLSRTQALPPHHTPQ